MFGYMECGGMTINSDAYDLYKDDLSQGEALDNKIESSHCHKLSCLKEQRILYAEDDDETRYVMQDILNDYVAGLFIAKNGAEAFEIFKNEGSNIDLVLTDILMPGLNGIELLDHIRSYSENADMPVVLATAFSDTEYLLDSIRLKCSGYILKPINLHELIDVLYAALLPSIHMREIARKNELLGVLGTFIGGKKAEVVRYIIDNSDKDHIFYGAHEDVANALSVTRQTVVNVFQKLIDVGLLEKVKNKSYRLCSKELDSNMLAQE